MFISPSVVATTVATVASPVTLTTVRSMSKILSTPNIRARPSAGTLIAPNTITNITIPAPGTAAAPIDANVAVKTIVSCCERSKSIPNT